VSFKLDMGLQNALFALQPKFNISRQNVEDITSFFVKDGTSEEDAVIASKFTLCYYNVKHRHLQHKIKPLHLQ
jgi:hypothetical protein